MSKSLSLSSLIGRSLSAPLARLWRDDGGVTAIEFGLLATPFFAVIGAILETSMVFLAGGVMDGAVQDATRLIRTGKAQSPSFTVAQFETLICDRLFGLFRDCDELRVSVTPVVNFTSATVVSPVDPNCTSSCPWTIPEEFDTGQTSSTVLVQVYYKWPLMLSAISMQPTDLADGTRLLGSVRVFRNEPF